MKPGRLVATDGAMTDADTVGAVLSTVTLKLAVALLAALSVALTVQVLAPAATTASAVTAELRKV